METRLKKNHQNEKSKNVNGNFKTAINFIKNIYLVFYEVKSTVKATISEHLLSYKEVKRGHTLNISIKKYLKMVHQYRK